MDRSRQYALCLVDQRKEVCPIRRVGWSYSKRISFQASIIKYAGDIYMGGVKGLLHINSKLPLTTSELPQLQLSNVIINGESVNDKLNGNPKGISAP